MRGRKLFLDFRRLVVDVVIIKKESPNEGTETFDELSKDVKEKLIKKESPNEGTETPGGEWILAGVFNVIKKESPNEGTETCTTV